MNEADTLIVGAGIAGLAAGRALAARGQRVIIIEARDRIGGRIWSHDGFDFGAHWIHGAEGNPLNNLARAMGLSTWFVGGDSTYTGGWERMVFPARPDGEKDKSIIASDTVHDAMDEQRARLGHDISLAEAFEQALARTGLPKEGAALARWHLALSAREDCAAGAERLSARYWDDGYEVYGYGDSLFPDGYACLTDSLAGGLDIRLSQPVSEVRTEGSGVIVTCGQTEYRGRRVIITVPLGVLKSGAITFAPPLPAAKLSAIDRLGYGTLAKIGLRFAEPFWPVSNYVFGLPPGDDMAATVIVNRAAIDGRAELTLLAGGALGEQIERKDNASAREWAMCQLQRVFGDLVTEPIQLLRTGWRDDPWSQGSYSYVAVGSAPGDFAALAEPVSGRLCFAGEATSDRQWGTAHGAYISGLREAARILGDPTLLPPRNFTENRRWRNQLSRANRFFNLRAAELETTDLAERTALLARSTPFAEIAPSELRLLATMFEPVTFAQGDWICRERDTADCVYLIATGELEVMHEPTGVVVATVATGALIGEYGLFHGSVRTASMRARTGSLLYRLDYLRFERFLLAFPQASLALLRSVISRQQ